MAPADLSVHATSVPRTATKNGLNVREDTIYTDAKGNEKVRIRKRADQAIECLGEILRKVLEKDETIFYLAPTQVMPGALEQLVLGWHLYALPRVLLVFTDRRIIGLRIRSRSFANWKWDRGIRTMRWGDMESASVKGALNRMLKLKLRSGEGVSYWRISRADAKKLKLVVPILRERSSGQVSASGGSNSLCPACFSLLLPGRYECPQCQLAFKDEKTLLWRGILVPGGASFYIGMGSLGVLRLLFESALLFVIVARILDGILGQRQEAAAAFSAALIFLAVLSFEKSVAIWSSRRQIRDFLPLK